MDIDTILDYKSNCGDERIMNFPSENECLKLLQSLGVSRNIVLHPTEVAKIAVLITGHLISRGWHINLGLVMAAGLLHDIAKGTIKHAQRGQKIVSELGYDAVADIASHMDLPSHMITTINEAGIIYLADKIVNGSRALSLWKKGLVTH